MHEDVWVVDLVIEVIELHGTALEGMLLVHFLFLLRLSGRHQNTLLEEVSRCHYGVSVKFSVVLDVLDPNVVCIGVMLRTNVRVSGALLYQMANFLAAVAPDVFGLFLRLLLVRVQVFLVVLLRFVTIVLAPWLVFILFTAAPPDFSGVLTTMDAATPLEIVFLEVRIPAIFTDLLQDIHFALLGFQLLDDVFHLFALGNEILLLLL